MNTLEQIVASHPCPIIRAKIMENVDKDEQYNDISEVVGAGFQWYLTKEGSDFWDGVCGQFDSPYSDLKHLDKSYVPDPIPPIPKWLPIDMGNLPVDRVAVKNDDNQTHYGKLWIYGNRIRVDNDNILNPTHYIPLSDLLNLPIAE